MQKLLKEVEQAKRNKEKRLKNIKCYTSWVKFVGERQVLEAQAKEQYDELVHSLMEKIKTLKETSSTGKERQSTKRTRASKEEIIPPTNQTKISTKKEK